jgi:hypothetical protein
MEPYVIRQGDYLLQVAHTFGFDADTVWNDDKNSDLARLRPDHNILRPGDILYIPDQAYKTPDYQSLNTGATNSFVADAPTTTINIQFSDAQLASQACIVVELDHLTGLTTDGSGLLTFAAPVTLQIATITFSVLALTYSCRIGFLDPINTLSGIYQRLQNLGYIDDAIAFDATNLTLVRGGLCAFKANVSTPNAPDNVATSDAPPDSAQASASDASAGADSTPKQDPTPVPDDELKDGLKDDGTLDDETSHLLLTAHGC